MSSLISAVSIVCHLCTAAPWGEFWFLSWLSQMLAQISALIDYLCGYLIDLLIWMTDLLGTMPFSYLYLARPEPGIVVFYYLTLVVAFLCGLSKPARGTIFAILAGCLLISYCFLQSSALEFLVAPDRVLIGRPFDPPILLQLQMDNSSPASNINRESGRGYLPAFHRDFMQSYVRAISAPACSNQTITAVQSCKIVSDGGRLTVCFGGGSPLLAKVLEVSNADHGLKISLPPQPAALVMEEAQGLRFYRLKMWGLLAIMAGRH
jgi:hypothetical protein